MEQNNVTLAITPFEKNVDIWRQLWRVIEKSDLLLQVSIEALLINFNFVRLSMDGTLTFSTQKTWKSISQKSARTSNSSFWLTKLTTWVLSSSNTGTDTSVKKMLLTSFSQPSLSREYSMALKMLRRNKMKQVVKVKRKPYKSKNNNQLKQQEHSQERL